MKIKGITLFELVIVMVLLAILSVSLAVKMTTFNDIKLSSAASKLAADISYAQQLATTTQIFHGISFDITGNQYFLFQDTTSTKIKDPYNRANDFVVDYDTALDLSVVILNTAVIGSGTVLTFNGLGTPCDSGKSPLSSNGTITLKCGTSTKTITIYRETGKVSW